jgi:hypothetical protein
MSSMLEVVFGLRKMQLMPWQDKDEDVGYDRNAV